MSALSLDCRCRITSCGGAPGRLNGVTSTCVGRGRPALITVYCSDPSRAKRARKRSAPTCCRGLGRLSACINRVIRTMGSTNVLSSAVFVLASSRKNVGGNRNNGAVRRVRATFVVSNGGVGGKLHFSSMDVVRCSMTSAVTRVFGLRRPRI